MGDKQVGGDCSAKTGAGEFSGHCNCVDVALSDGSMPNARCLDCLDVGRDMWEAVVSGVLGVYKRLAGNRALGLLGCTLCTCHTCAIQREITGMPRGGVQ